jgi:hypothetical protein
MDIRGASPRRHRDLLGQWQRKCAYETRESAQNDAIAERFAVDYGNEESDTRDVQTSAVIWARVSSNLIGAHPKQQAATYKNPNRTVLVRVCRPRLAEHPDAEQIGKNRGPSRCPRERNVAAWGTRQLRARDERTDDD